MPDNSQIEVFLLILVRCLTFFNLGPLMADRKIPGQVKILLALASTFALYPTVSTEHWVLEKTLLGYGLLIGREVLLGAALAMAASMVFIGVRMAGNLLGIQMGFSIVNVFDPNTASEVSLVGQLQELLAIFIFLLVDGHHFLLRALSFSLQRVPPGGNLAPAALAGALLPMAGTMFVTTLQVGAPVLGALFLTDAALGFVARAVPQMNVFIVGIPVKIGVGLLLLIATAPLFARLMTWHFSVLEGQLLTLLGGM
jgi:flagellar biosynthesis protein FliR